MAPHSCASRAGPVAAVPQIAHGQKDTWRQWMDGKDSPSSPQAPNIFLISWELVGKEYMFHAGWRRREFDESRISWAPGHTTSQVLFLGGTWLHGGKCSSLQRN